MRGGIAKGNSNENRLRIPADFDDKIEVSRVERRTPSLNGDDVFYTENDDLGEENIRKRI